MGETLEFEMALLSWPVSLLCRKAGQRMTDLIVVRVIDQTVLAINEHPVEAARVDDGLGQGCGGVSATGSAGTALLV